MATTGRLQTFGHWGAKAREPFVFDVNAVDLKRQAKLAMGHGLSAAQREAQPYQRGIRRLYDEREAPLCLTWNRTFRDDWNAPAAWGGGTYLTRLERSFGGDAFVLSHEQDLAVQNVSYTSTFVLLKNQPFSLRIFVFKSPNNPQQDIVSAYFGGRWLLQVVGGKVTIARLAPSWTQALQDTADILVGAQEFDNDAGYDADIDEFRNAYYEAFESLGGDISLDAGTFVDLEIIPEPLGALTILSSGFGPRVDSTHIEIPALIEATDLAPDAEQTVTALGYIRFNTKGPAFQWQVGEHLRGDALGQDGDGKNYHGQVLCPTNIIVDTGDEEGGELSDLTALTRASLPGGSDVTAGLEDTGTFGFNDDGSPTTLHKFELSVRFYAPDARYTPFLYSGQLVLPARGHVGEGTPENFNSDDYPLDPSKPNGPRCLDDITMSCEAEGWARKATVSIYDIEGHGLKLSPLYEAQENRIANVMAGGAYVIRNGIVVSADRGDMRTTIPGQDGQEVAKIVSMAVLQVLDKWFLLDEPEEMSPLILDGLTLGAASRLIWRDAGFSENELIDIPAEFGARLPVARLNEDPLIVCSGSPGSMLRQLWDDYGMGAKPYDNPATGRWAIGQPSAAPVRSFVRSPYTSPDLMFGTLDFARDYSECYNEITVIGGVNVRGETLSRTWTVRAGFQSGYADGFNDGAYSQVHIGRKKRKVIRRPELRTADDVLRVLRSNVLQYGNSGRFVSCETYADWGLRPGVPVLLEGRKYTVAKLGDCSAKANEGRGRMINVYREENMAI